MEKKYLITSVVINLIFYILIFIASSDKNSGPLFNFLVLFSVLFIIDFLLSFIGWRMLKKYPQNKHIRFGFIINITPIIVSLLYLIIFEGIRPA